MLAEKVNFLEDINQPKLRLAHTQLPEAIKKIVDEIIQSNSERCLVPEKALGRCLQMSHELVNGLASIGKTPFVDSKIIFRQRPKPHFWVYVDGYHIDLTARQFDPLEQCPKVWKQEDLSSTDYFLVEKGKGFVLFKLVPCNKRGFFVSLAKQMISLARKKYRNSVKILFNKLDVRILHIYRRGRLSR